MKYFINAGPFFAYLLKQTFVYPAGSFYPDEKYRDDNTNYDKRTDLGIAAGFGISVPLNDRFIFAAEIRDNLGLYNVSAVPVYKNGSIKTNSTNLLIGFACKLAARQAETK